MANEEITLTFREAMNELSAIVEALESNTLELEAVSYTHLTLPTIRLV